MRTALRTLLIEHSEADASRVIAAQRDGGYEPEWERVDTRTALIAALVRQSWDVITCEYLLPHLTAAAALQVIHEHSIDAPVILVCGALDEHAAVALMKSGAHDYVSKHDLTRLVPAIAREVRQAEERRARKQADAALRRREQYFRALIENAQDLVAILKRDGTVLYASPSHERILGLNPDDVIGKNAFDLTHPDDRSLLTEHLATIAQTPGSTIAAEFRFRHRDGSWRIMECLARNLLHDPAVGGVVINSRDVTERAYANAARREIEERYRCIAENAYDLIAEVGTDARLLYVSPNHAAVLGYQPSELVGRIGFDLMHPDDRPGVLALFDEEKARTRFRFLHKNGSWRWFEGTGNAFQTPTGGRRAVVISRDITDRKEADDKLAASENRLRAIIAAEPECVKVLGRDGTLLEMNPAGLAMMEADSLEQVLGRCLYPYVTDEYREAFQRLTERAFEGHEGTLEFQFRALKGTARWADTHVVPLRNEKNEIISVLAVTRDTTARKHAEAAQRDEARVSAALARVGGELIASLNSPGLLERLCHVSADVLGCDSSHTLFWQPEEDVFRPLAGYGASAEEQQVAQVMRVPRSAMRGLLDRLASDDVAEVGTIPSDVLSQPEQQRFGVTVALCMALRRDSHLVGLQVVLARGRRKPFTDIDRRIARGIAQAASLALEHARVARELDRANRLKSDFVATMSHELRTPLSVMIGYTDLILEGAFGPLNAEQAESLARVHSSSRELLDLINATLDLSRLETGQVPLEIRPVVIHDLLHEIDVETRELQSRSNLQFVWQVAPDLPPIHTDPLKLKLVVKNLIGNAVKFTERGSVTVAAHANNGLVEIAVTDTGIGIAPAALPIIFDPFRQADSSSTRRHGGVGLGLYIVRRLLDLLGGTVKVDTEVGRGSTFRVGLPTGRGAA